MVTKIQLKETSQAIKDFTGYQLILLFQKKTSATDNTLIPFAIMLDVPASGKVDLNQDNFQPEGPVTASIKASTGNILFTKDIDKNSLLGQQSFQLDFTFEQLKLNSNITIPAGIVNGRVIDITGKKKLDEVQVIIFAVAAATPDLVTPLLTVTTETGGYFSIPYPDGEFISAFGLVGVDTAEGKNKVNITLEKNAEGKNVFPKRLLLVVEVSEAVATTDCGCNEIDFSDNKRVLDEFSYYSIIRTSDPEIKAYAINVPEEISLDDLLKATPTSSNPILTGIIADPVRVFGHPALFNAIHTRALAFTTAPAVAGTAAVATTAPPVINNDNISEAVKNIKIKKTVVRDFMDKYKVLNKDTYLNLLEMNDAAKVNEAVLDNARAPLGRAALDSHNLVDWDNDPTIYQATSIAYGHILHYKQQWIADGFSLGDLVYSLPLAPGQKKQIVVFDWERRESASNTQAIDYEESLDNSLSRDRDINEIATGVVNEKMNGSSSSTVKSASAGLGLAIGPMVLGASGGISKGSSNATQDSMRNTSARDAQHLSDKTVQAANAVRSQRSTVIQTVSQGERYEVSAESVANYNHCHALTIEYFEVLRHFKVQQKLADAQECLFVPLPISVFDIDKARRWKEILSAALLDRSFKRSFDALQRVKDRWEHSDFPATTFAAENILTLTASLKIKIELTCPRDMLQEKTRTIYMANGMGSYTEDYTVPVYDPSQWQWLRDLLGINPDDFYNSYIKDRINKDDIFRKQLGDKIAQKIINSLEFKVDDDTGHSLPVGLDASLASSFHNGVPLAVSVRSGATGIPREKYTYFKIGLKDDLPLPDFTKILVVSGSANYRTKHMAHSLFNYNVINDDLGPGDGVSIYCGPAHDELRNPKEEDMESVNGLLHHLNANLEFYHKMIWLYMTPERRFMLLDGINLFIEKEQVSRSVASLVANKLIGIVGNSLVLPVIPGLNLNPDFAPAMLNEATGELVPLVDYYAHEPLDPLHISVPTKGVFAEAMMGKCNSCEIKDEQRFWRWEESPIPDSPTAISPIVTPTPTVTQPNLQANPLSNPVVNIQNAPAAPDPQGLASVLSLLGKGDTFKDITGLTANQQNALAGLQASLNTTGSFGQMGLDLKKANLSHELESKKLDIESQKLDADNSMRQQKLSTMAQLLKDKVINKDDFDKYLANEGMSPELKNVKDANAAEKNGDISKEQKENLTPKSTTQSLDELKQKEAAINDAVSKGSMTPEKGKELIGKLYSDALNNASAKGYTPEDITAMTKAVSENKVGSLSATPDSVEIKGQPDATGGILPEAWADVDTLNSAMLRTFNPDTNDKSAEIIVEAKVSDAPAGATFAWSTDKADSLQIVSPGLAKTKILAGEPGITSLSFEIFDSANKSLRKVSMDIGVPQFFVVTDSAMPYAVFDGGRNITGGYKFDVVLDQLGVLSAKDTIVNKIKEYVESRLIRRNGSALSGNNLRMLWKLGNLNDAIPNQIFNPKNVAAPQDSDGYYNLITISGYPTAGALQWGVTIPNPAQPGNASGPKNFIESIRIFTGAFELNSLTATSFTTDEDKDVFNMLHQLITAFKADPANQRLISLVVDTFARVYADVICHEIYHSVIYHGHDAALNVTDAGYDSQGHTLGGVKDIMSAARDFARRTGILVQETATVKFPDVGSYTVNSFAANSILNADNQERIDAFFPLPPNAPFDK